MEEEVELHFSVLQMSFPKEVRITLWCLQILALFVDLWAVALELVVVGPRKVKQ